MASGIQSDATLRNVAVVTGGRADYGVLVPLLRAIDTEPRLNLGLWATGAHFSPQFGTTLTEIIDDGFQISEKIDVLLASDTPEAIAKTMGAGVSGFAQAYARNRPDIVVGLGDRYELLAAVEAALPFNIPVAHISGGEVTEGAMDESIRHAVTKLSHLHFVAAEEYARRVIQMGEEPWRVHVTGEPGLDNLRTMNFLGREQLAQRIGMQLPPDLLLVTFHPVTLEHERTAAHIKELLAALHELSRPVVFTYPNADTGRTTIIDALEQYVTVHTNARVVRSLGRLAYCSLMKVAAAMVGNSSSGIIEAASIPLPVVNIGTRQQGRLMGSNVISCAAERVAIAKAIREATSKQFVSSIAGMINPYGDGHAAERIVKVLREVPLDQKLIRKRFHDLKQTSDPRAAYADAQKI